VKIAHWVKFNMSGMNNVATMMCEGEKKLGLDSFLVDTDDKTKWIKPEDSDIDVVHTHLSPDSIYSDKKVVWVAHGTPEVMFQSAYEQAIVYGSYGHADGWMLCQFWLKRADAIVTFWPRHAAIWKSMTDRNTSVNIVPMGVDREFWKPIESAGKFLGGPSVFTAENSYQIKWPYDLFIAWPWVVSQAGLHESRLHAIYLPKDQHRFYFPLVNANGSSFAGFITSQAFNKDQMRNAFCSTDYYCNLVRYGDFNTVSMEARSCGAKVISYKGNSYASYWIDEGDQRVMAEQISEILLGKVDQRKDITPVPDSESTAGVMKALYEKL
jgi:glycosyltransferase involved in cell wall biosynthesis